MSRKSVHVNMHIIDIHIVMCSQSPDKLHNSILKTGISNFLWMDSGKEYQTVVTWLIIDIICSDFAKSEQPIGLSQRLLQQKPGSIRIAITWFSYKSY